MNNFFGSGASVSLEEAEETVQASFPRKSNM